MSIEQQILCPPDYHTATEVIKENIGNFAAPRGRSGQDTERFNVRTSN